MTGSGKGKDNLGRKKIKTVIASGGLERDGEFTQKGIREFPGE